MKKIITAISLGVVFIVTFAVGVGCIVRGVGDFSWDKISEYVSLSDVVQINEDPISNIFEFSDHTDVVNSHAEGKILCPTNGGEIKIEDIPATTTIVASDDEYIHVTFDGEIKESCVVKSADNLTGTNIPNMEFKYNQKENEAVIRFKHLRTNNSNPKMTIAIPTTFSGELDFSDVAGKIEGEISLSLTELSVEDVAGKIVISGISAREFDVSNIAGEIDFSNGSFNSLEASDAAGKISVKGKIGRFEISDIMGNITVESNSAITGNCKISDVMGDVDVNLPSGSSVNVNQSGVMGKVSVNNNSSSAQYTIKLEEIMGKVNINN